MASVEGNIYRFKVTVGESYFRIKSIGNSKINVVGLDQDEAEEKLFETILKLFGDGEPSIEYVNYDGDSNLVAKYGDPEIVEVSGNGSFGKVFNSEKIWLKGPCKKCKRQERVRSNIAAEVEYFPKEDIVSIGWMNRALSSDFISLLSKKELKSLQFRKVIGPGKRSFYELVGKPKIKHIGVPGFPGLVNIKCAVCKLGCFTYLHKGEMFNFIALKDIPKPIPSVFAVKDVLGEARLCMTKKRFQEILKRKKCSKGIISKKLWIVKDNKFIRDNFDESYPEEKYHRVRYL